MFKGKKSFSLSGAGMIGRELVSMLVDKGANVRVADLGAPTGVPEEVEFCRVDLRV